MDAPPQRPGSLPGRLLLTLALVLSALPAGSAAAQVANPVIMAAGDVACDNAGIAVPGDCSHLYTSNLALQQRASPEGLAAVLVPGDLQYEDATLAEFRRGFGPTWGRLGTLLKPVPGNHEYQTSGAAGYFDYFQSIGAQAGTRGQGWYSFNVGTSWHVIGLNSSDGCRPVSCAAGSAQYRFLQADLAANTRNCVIAFMHHPVANNAMAGRGRPLWELLYGAGVDFVLVGHTHSYRAPRALNPDGDADPNGPRETVVGTGGKSGGSYGLFKMTLRANAADWRFVGSGTTSSGTTTCRTSAPPPPPPPPPPPVPQASFTVTTSGLAASFTDTSTNTPTGWTWDFGDGTSAGAADPTPNPTHTYARPGTYTVRLTASNRGGDGAVTRTVTVAAPGTPPPVTPAGPPVPVPVPQPPPRRATSTQLTFSTAKGRGATRRIMRDRLRRWRLTRVTCRKPSSRVARCTVRAKRGKRRLRATATLTLPRGARQVRYRLVIRITGKRRPSTFTGRERLSSS
jgi:PKD repeat protein